MNDSEDFMGQQLIAEREGWHVRPLEPTVIRRGDRMVFYAARPPAGEVPDWDAAAARMAADADLACRALRAHEAFVAAAFRALGDDEEHGMLLEDTLDRLRAALRLAGH